MLHNTYSTLANLKQAYKEADKERKKQAYDAMKARKRESKAKVLVDDKQLENAVYVAILTGYKTTIGNQQ